MDNVEATRPRVGRNLIYGLIDPRDRCLRYVGKTHKRREWRLGEHIQHASDGSTLPVHRWIRELLTQGSQPEIVVLERLPPDVDWRTAEVEAIRLWRNWLDAKLPYTHPPQTPKSKAALILKVSLLNVSSGG
jgi:hypothetical protein